MFMRPIAIIASRRVVLGLTVSALSASAWAQTPVVTSPSASPSARVSASASLLRGKAGQPADLSSLKVLREAARRAHAEHKNAKAASPNPAQNTPEAHRQRLLRKTSDRLGGLLQDRQIRAFPFDKIAPDTYIKAIRQRESLSPAAWSVSGVSASSDSVWRTRATQLITPSPLRWESVGPFNMSGPSTFGFGPGAASGRVNGVAYDASALGVAYLVSPTGGLWKTIDNGNNWTPLGDRWEKMDATCVATHPTDGRTVFVGLGDYNGLNGLYGTGGNGIRRSQDGGLTWSIRTPSMTDQLVSGIVVDKTNPQIVMATTGRGGTLGYLLRSNNGGDTFAQATGFSLGWDGRGHWSDIKASTAPGGSTVYFATCNRSGAASRDGLYYSFDTGANWTRVNPPAEMVGLGFEFAGFNVAPSATDPKVVYLVRAEDGFDYQAFKGTLTTNDAGALQFVTWENVTSNLKDARWGQTFYNTWAQAIPVTRQTGNSLVSTDVLMSATVGVGGQFAPSTTALWRDISQTYTGQDIFHTDQHTFAVNPNSPTELLIGNDGGVYRVRVDTSAFQISGQSSSLRYFTEASLNRSLAITEFYRADWHPTNPNRMLGGTQDNSTPVASGDIRNWQAVIGGDGSACAIDQSNPNIQFGATQYTGNFIRTTNNWVSGQNISIFNSPFSALAEGEANAGQIPFIPQMALTTGANGSAYLGTRYLWRWNPSTTPGQPATWTPQLGGQPLAGAGQYVIAIAVAPSDPNRIYTGSVDGQLWMTTNNGTTWRRLNTNNSNLPARAITAIAVHPTQPNRITLTLGGNGTPHVWGVTNTDISRITFTQRSGSVPGSSLPDITANAIALDYTDPINKMFVGTDVGVFATADSGVTWTNATEPLGLPNVRVSNLKAVPGTGYLNAATFGRGMWRIPIGIVQDIAPFAVTATASRRATTLTVNARIENTGNYTFTSFNMTGAALSFTDINGLDARRSTTTPLPLRTGTMPAKTFIVRPVVFDVTSVTPGTQATLIVTGTIVVGNGSRQVTTEIPITIP